MKTYLLNGQECTSRGKFHDYVAEQLEFPDYYVKNLDALWDMLMEINEETKIYFTHASSFIYHLGDYGEKILETFMDGARGNNHIYLVIE